MAKTLSTFPHFGIRLLLLLTDRSVLYQSMRPVERYKVEERVPINYVSTTARRRWYFRGHADVRIVSCHYAYSLIIKSLSLTPVPEHLTLKTQAVCCYVPTIFIWVFLQFNQQDAPVSQIIYSCKTLYMFRTVFPSITRSSKLHTGQQAYVKQLLL